MKVELPTQCRACYTVFGEREDRLILYGDGIMDAYCMECVGEGAAGYVKGRDAAMEEGDG